MLGKRSWPCPLDFISEFRHIQRQSCIIPFPRSICLSTRLNTQGAKCLPSSSSLVPPTYCGGWWRLSTPEETELGKVGWATCQEAAAGQAGEALPAPRDCAGSRNPLMTSMDTQSEGLASR